MYRPRVIVSLLLQDNTLVKGINFDDYRYIGDPLNACKIFSKKEVDELIFLDIDATKKGLCVSKDLIEDIADECFVPFAVGGGITNLSQIKELLYSGAEKVVLNSSIYNNPNLLSEASSIFGRQAIVVSINVIKSSSGYYKLCDNSKNNLSQNVFDWVKMVERKGAGEILINSVHSDGKMEGYDIELISKLSSLVNIPVIALGGAGSLEDMSLAIKKGGANAVAAGSFFVFQSSLRGVLINTPSKGMMRNFYRSLSE